MGAFERLMLGMLRLEPKERITAKEAVKMVPAS